MSELCRRIADSSRFQGFVIAVILFAGALVGVETSAELTARHAPLLHLLNQVVLGIFIAEIAIKMAAEGNRPWRYFHDGWNTFDFLIVAACFMPVGGQYVTVLRLARLLRVLKLVRALPKLQLLVGALLRSIPSMGYVSVLLGLLFYVYGVAGVFLFADNDPVRFGDLQSSMLTLFRTVTLEDWTDVMYTQLYGCDVYGYGMREELCTTPEASPHATIPYFVSFVLIGTMIVLNLFVGVIMTGMQEAQAEADTGSPSGGAAGEATQADLLAEIARLRAQVAAMDQGLAALATRAESQRPPPMPTPPDDPSASVASRPAVVPA